MNADAKAGVKDSVREQDLLQSGGFGRSTNSARAGFLPISLEHAPLGALSGLEVYIRVKPAGQGAAEQPRADDSTPGFRLYCKSSMRFTEVHRRRLAESGVKFVYIKIADQSRFRQQNEAHLLEAVNDPVLAIAQKSTLVYETSVELMNELLAEPDTILKSPRLEKVSRAITTLVMNDPSAFSHLFAASYHDFYTATHMVNVATWMVPVAYEMGYHDPEELGRICQAGILHDMGKTMVSQHVLNKAGKLSDEDWAQIRRHPEAGCEYLSRFSGVHPLILTVTRQHHERMDGTGYPAGLKGDQIDPVSRICAVVDSFDAMTAFRPFKEKTLGVGEALMILNKETPAKYDPKVVAVWMRLMKKAEQVQNQAGPQAAHGAAAGAAEGASPVVGGERRQGNARRTFHCAGRAHVLVAEKGGLTEQPALPIIAHSISCSGLGFLSQAPLTPGEFIRVYLQAKGWDNRPLEGQTVRSRTYNDSWYEIGMKFANAKNELLVESPMTTAQAA